jgi:hypothetical protein
MITIIIFYLHIVFGTAIFTKRLQDAGKGDAFLSLGFMALIFGVGWSVTTVILKIFFEKPGLALWLDRDTMSLLLLTILEAIFYSIYFKREKKKNHLTAE